MSRLGVLVALLAGCGAASNAADAGAGNCPTAPPPAGGACTTQYYYECAYPDQVCGCDPGLGSNPTWRCRSSACPPYGQAGACSQPGLICSYGFEATGYCVAPENVWLWCGGGGQCDSNPGSLCCGSATHVCGNPAFDCSCGGDHHVQCANLDGGA